MGFILYLFWGWGWDFFWISWSQKRTFCQCSRSFLLWQHPQHVAVLENIYSGFTNDAFLFQEHPVCNSVTPVHIEEHSNKLKMLVMYRISEKNGKNTLSSKLFSDINSRIKNATVDAIKVWATSTGEKKKLFFSHLLVSFAQQNKLGEVSWASPGQTMTSQN